MSSKVWKVIQGVWPLAWGGIGSPWQNGYVERIIRSIRQEMLDHVIVMGEAHLRQLLRAYADYYNTYRTHLGLDKDTPLGRPVQHCGRITPIPRLGGLHHAFVRI